MHRRSTYVPVILAKPVTISGNKESRPYIYKQTSSAWKLLRYQNPIVYDSIISKMLAPSTCEYGIKVKMELWDDWETKTGVVFEGYIPLVGIEINKDNGIVILTPEEIRPGYDWIEQHENDKFNITSLINESYLLNYSVDTVLEEYYIPGLTVSAGIEILRGFNWTTSPPATYSTIVDYTPGYLATSYCTGSDGVEYKCIKANGPSSTLIAPTASGGDEYWEAFDMFEYRVYRAWRYITDMPFTGDAGDFIQGNGIFESGFPVTVEDIDEATNCPTYWWYSKAATAVESGAGVIAENHHCDIMLAIKYMLYESGLNIASQFFTDAINPVTGEANIYTNTRLIHSTVIKGRYNSNTECDITLAEILNDLCEIFNLSWNVQGDDLVLEHINYFLKGGSYSGSPSVYTDLGNTSTYPPRYQVVNDLLNNETDNSFKFTLPDSAEKDKFHVSDGYDSDGEIKYTSVFVKIAQEEKHETRRLSTDLVHLLSMPDDTSDDSYCIVVATYPDFTVIRENTAFKWTEGVDGSPRTFERYADDSHYPYLQYPNGDLTWFQILPKYWIYNRPFLKGKVNGLYPASTFLSQKKTKKQKEIIFPRMEAGLFDPLKLINTNVDDGEVNEYEINTDTDFIKVSLLYAMD